MDETYQKDYDERNYVLVPAMSSAIAIPNNGCRKSFIPEMKRAGQEQIASKTNPDKN